MTYFEKLFEKIRNQEKLDKKELMIVERALKMEETYTNILNIQIGISNNNMDLKYADERQFKHLCDENPCLDEKWQKEFCDGLHRDRPIQYREKTEDDGNVYEWKTFAVWSNIPNLKQPKAFDENYEWRIMPDETKYIKTEGFRVKGVKTFEEIPRNSEEK